MAMASPSSSSSPRWEFKVFLSFRGEDTRSRFTSHLYQALDLKGIHTFMDEEELRLGEKIGENLWRAIERSGICIPILSENYAESRWCLMELAMMFRCKKKVIPVFYHVVPSDVRHQKGPFEKAFRDHESRFGKEKVQEWRESFRNVAELKGYDLKNIDNGNEAKLIQLIVKEVLRQFDSAPLDVVEYLVGIDSRAEDVMKLLSLEVKDVKMVGIHGMGGIGKTTLSRVIYNRLFDSFDACSFIPNIREAAAQHRLVNLQEKLIANILGGKEIKIDDTSRGAVIIKERFHTKRVLVVLDDVDHEEQIKALAVREEWLGKGSRVIVTTRNEHVLNVQNIQERYQPDYLNNVESLQLFSHHAFGRVYPTEKYVRLSKKIVSATGGLPLALEVFGCFLFDKNDVKEWQDFLEKLKRIPFNDVQKRLRISYDGLDHNEQKIFLDIACLLVGMDKDDAIYVWNTCDLYANLTVKVLLHKSLIKVDKSKKLEMHDQLRDMGRWIVRECHPYEPSLHSRLWLHEEVLDVLGENKVCTNEMIHVFYFQKLPNLRLLRANFARFKGYEHMPKELRWLEWHGCPLRSLPDYATLDKVAVLDLSKSKIERLWHTKWWWWSRKKVFASLRVLHLSDCLHLETTPDFSTMPLLEKLSLDGCENLREVHESIGDLQRLVVLNMSSCSKLIRLPDSFCRLSSLEELSLMHLRVKLLPSKIGLLKNLHRLYLYGCSDLEELPDSIGNMTKLEELDLNGCERLGTLPASLGNMEDLTELDLNGCGIESLPSSISSLKKLKELKLWCCRQLSSLPASVQSMTWLEKLDVRSCSKLKSLPDCIGRIENLVELNFDGQNMKELPDSIVYLKNMKKLRLYWCSMLERLPDQIGRMTKLEKLDLRFCKSLRTLPDSIGNMTNLVELDISFTGIEHLPGSIVYLEKLTTLRMLRCTKPRGLPLGRMKGLQHLLVMGNGEKEFKHEPYYEVSETISQKSGYCQQTQEFRMIQFTSCKEEHSVWEVQWKLFIRLGNQEKVIQVEETHMKDWGWNRGMQWLGLLFTEDFVLDDEPSRKKQRTH
ncbi:disease resistance protein RUN1-like [Nymphaea colorata]|nr:disease resistance protein RUN1-like [Nymphaea colorata]